MARTAPLAADPRRRGDRDRRGAATTGGKGSTAGGGKAAASGPAAQATPGGAPAKATPGVVEPFVEMLGGLLDIVGIIAPTSTAAPTATHRPRAVAPGGAAPLAPQTPPP
jgi:hypothetical protein